MKYTDEDLGRARAFGETILLWPDREYVAEGQILAQLIADVRRERTERAERGIEELVSEMLVLRERLDKTEAERDEARRVAKGLAWALCDAADDCDVCSDKDREMLRIARAYPEKP